MRVLGRPDTNFARALARYGLERCSLSGAALCVGLAPDPEYRRLPIGSAPEAPEWICFLEGPLQADLVAALAASPEARAIRRLAIGTTHDYASGRRGGYDLSAAVAALAQGRFPALRRVALGDMEQLHNGHRLFGVLGDIAHLFAAAPELERLSLHGRFALGRTVRHARLREFSAELDDIGVSGGPLGQDVLDRLLSSAFDRLETLRLDLDDADREADYSLPDAFFVQERFPSLTELAIDCLTAEAAARLAAWKAARGVR